MHVPQDAEGGAWGRGRITGMKAPTCGRSARSSAPRPSERYKKVWLDGRQVREHVLVATRVLGKPLPPGAEVHHVNADTMDNRNCNLVICQDHSYHMLLEQRAAALAECGHAGWIRCGHCGELDDPANMYLRPNGRSGFHRVCNQKYQRDRRRKARAQCG